MSKTYKDMLIDMSKGAFSESDYATLNQLSELFTFESADFNSKQLMANLWYDVTHPSEEHEKQKDWRLIGSDQIINDFAVRMEDVFKSEFETLQHNFTLDIAKRNNISYEEAEELGMSRTMEALNEAHDLLSVLMKVE